MRAQRSFRPSLDNTLEGRVALTGIAPVALRNAEFTAPINPTLHMNTVPRNLGGASFISTSVRTTPVINAGHTTPGSTGLNLTTTNNSSFAGAGTGLTSGTNLGSLLGNGLSTMNTGIGLFGNNSAFGNGLSSVNTGNGLFGNNGAANLGSVLTTAGVNSLSSLFNGSTLGASNLGLGSVSNGSTGLSFLTNGFQSVATSGANLAGMTGFGRTGTFGLPANNNGAGFGTMV